MTTRRTMVTLEDVTENSPAPNVVQNDRLSSGDRAGTAETKMDRAEAFKLRGNALFASGKFREARELYDDALRTALDADDDEKTSTTTTPMGESSSPPPSVDGLKTIDGETSETLDARVAAYYANRAACSLRLEDYEAASKDCTAAIKIDKDYVKAYARRATAREALGDVEAAYEDYVKTLELAPRDGTAKRAKERLRPIVEKKREEMKDEMIKSMKDLGNSLLGNFGLSLDNFKAEKDETTGSYSIQFVNERRQRSDEEEEDE